MDNPHVFIDNTSPEIKYSSEWQVDTSATANNTFGNSQSISRAGSTPGVLQFEFTGKGAEIYGTLDPALKLDSKMDGANYTPLDDGEGNPPGRKGVKIYDLGVLSGPHTIRLSPQTGSLVIDYLLYTPVGKTELDGKQLAYDNTNPAFNYSGAWTPREQFDTTSLPFNNTLATTSQKGSSFAIDFVGSSIAVYGAINSTPGLLSATFSIDGSTPEPIVLANRSQATSDWTLHTLFFLHTFSEVNTEAPHILNVTVVETSESQPFQLDYALTTGNAHTTLVERRFEKTGEAAKSSGLKIGLIVLGIAVILVLGVAFGKWRSKRKKAKGLSELSKT